MKKIFLIAGLAIASTAVYGQQSQTDFAKDRVITSEIQAQAIKEANMNEQIRLATEAETLKMVKKEASANTKANTQKTDPNHLDGVAQGNSNGRKNPSSGNSANAGGANGVMPVQKAENKPSKPLVTPVSVGVTDGHANADR